MSQVRNATYSDRRDAFEVGTSEDLLHSLIRLEINGTRCLVEDKYFRLSQQRSGEANELPLTGTEIYTAGSASRYCVRSPYHSLLPPSVTSASRLPPILFITWSLRYA